MITVDVREEMSVNESRSFGSTVSVVDSDVSGGGGCEDLTLIL